MAFSRCMPCSPRILNAIGIFGYPLGDNHIRIGNRTRLYAVSVLDCHRLYYFPVPLFPGISISLGTKLQEFSTALLRHNL